MMKCKAYKYIIICFILCIAFSCNVYSFLSVDNESEVPIYLKYVQENGKTIEQEIASKEAMTIMFDKKWTDKNTLNVANGIKEITIYTSADTLFHSINKDEIYTILRSNRSAFKDRVNLKVK